MTHRSTEVLGFHKRFVSGSPFAPTNFGHACLRKKRQCESRSFASYSEIIADRARRITIAQDQVTLEIERDSLTERLLDQKVSSSREKDRLPISIEVPVRFRRRGVEVKLVVLNRQHTASEPDASLVKALANSSPITLSR
jgi:hypothetical protein